MKNYKKILFGLCLLIGVAAGSLLGSPHKAAALSKTDFQNATYKFDGSTSISANLGSAGTVAFVQTNNNPLSNLVFTPSPVTFNGGQFCSGSKITMTTAQSPTAQIDIKWFNTGSSGSCNSNPPFVGPQTYSGTIKITLTGVPPPANSGSTTSTCESNFVSPFSWIVCPVLSLADSIIGSAYGQVEGQLCFNTGTNSSTGGVVCNGPNSLVDGVKSAWSIFKNIASALLVIVMLVMVFSQAIGGGPFDAYTVRKMLPKLVAAVILMQLSFLLLKFAIDISNDFGSAIGRLMMAPFGGPANMDLGKLIGNGVHVATGSTGGQVAFDIFATIATIGAFVYAIPALPLLALYVIAGVFVAFFVLVLRKLLIIMLIILAPLAFVCWVLPGTERYWKLWSDNFLKLLAMFPLIMAMLSAGRIFAYITSKSGNGASMFSPHLAVAHVGRLPVPYFGSATGFADLAIIIGAFFAPYFLLPKTFSWGGQALGAAGKAVENMTNKATESPKKFLQNREESYRAERRRNSQRRFRAEQGFSWKRPQSIWQRPLDLARAGKLDPTLGTPRMKIPKGIPKVGGKVISEGSNRRQESIDRYSEAGQKAEQEAKAASEARIVNDRQRHRARGGDHDLYLQAISDGADSFYDPNLKENVDVSQHSRSEAGRMAARSQLGKLGAGMNWRYLENYYENTRKNGSDAQRAEMRKFFDDNVETILPKLPHIYKSVGQAADADPSGIAQMHGVGIEAVLSNLSKDITTGKTWDDAKHTERTLSEGEIQGKQRQLTTFLQNFQRAVENSQRGGPQLENGALRAVKGFLDRDPTVAQGLLEDINGTPSYQDASGVWHSGKNTLHGRNAPYRGKQDPAKPGTPPPIKGEEPRVALPLLVRSEVVETHMAPEQRAVVEGLRDSLGGLIDEAGYVRAQAAAPTATVPLAGTLRVEHVQAAAQTMPTGDILSAIAPTGEALKIQVKTNPNIAQTFANNIAFGGMNERAYRQVLAEIRSEAAAAGTDQAKQQYNDLVSQVQQALQQRVITSASAAAQRGHDVTGPWTAGSERITALEPNGPPPPTGTPDIRKLQ
jgi:hypothetical protein